MLKLTYEYKLIPTDAQSETFDQWLTICRKAYNFARRERKDWLNSRKCDINSCSIKQEYIIPADAPRPTFARQCKTLAEAKKSIPELKLPHAHVLQQVLRQLEAAFIAMSQMSAGMLFKQTLDAGFGQFLSILNHVCFKRSAYFAKVDANGTSQTCTQCRTPTGKKKLSERVHQCPECGYETNRDVAAA